MEKYIFETVLVWAVLYTAVYYSAKRFAKSNGLEINWWLHDWREFAYMVKLMRKGRTSSIRLKAVLYLALLTVLIISPLFWIVLNQ